MGSLSTRRAVTSVSSSRSWVRLRRSLLSDLQCRTLAAAAAPAITPAFQTISVCSLLTRRLILPHTCETQLHIQGPGRFAKGENWMNFYLPHIFCFVFFLFDGDNLGCSVDPLLLLHMRDSCALLTELVVYPLTWNNSNYWTFEKLSDFYALYMYLQQSVQCVFALRLCNNAKLS